MPPHEIRQEKGQVLPPEKMQALSNPTQLLEIDLSGLSTEEFACFSFTAFAGADFIPK